MIQAARKAWGVGQPPVWADAKRFKRWLAARGIAAVTGNVGDEANQSSQDAQAESRVSAEGDEASPEAEA